MKKSIIKELIKMTVLGVSIGCLILTIIGMTIATLNPNHFGISSVLYIKYGIAAMIIGIGFSVPSIIYDNENISMALKVLIHMGIGIIVYLIAATYAGWVPLNQGITAIFSYIIFSILISFIIWIGFYLYYKKEALAINEKIKK